MIHFFGNTDRIVFAVQSQETISTEDIKKLEWLFGGLDKLTENKISSSFIGPRAAMITPWSTNAVEITQNMGINGIIRIEEFKACDSNFSDYDPMIFEKFIGLDQSSFTVDIKPEPIIEITDIAAYNKSKNERFCKYGVMLITFIAKNIKQPVSTKKGCWKLNTSSVKMDQVRI